MSLKIATWNINSIKFRILSLCEFLNKENPDILLLQEIKCETEKFPYEALAEFPYNYYVWGQKSYNGVAILSKFRADEVIYDFPTNPCSHHARFLEITCQTPIGFCRIISLYAPNGGEVNSDKFEIKLKWYDSLILYLNSKKSFDEKLIIGGDFNIAPFDIDVYNAIDLSNTICFTRIEKQKIRTLLNYGFCDLYRLLHPKTQEFSWWDYRKGAFEQNRGMRIDLLVTSSNLVSNFKNCYIDYSIRTRPQPSDHAPVVAY